MRATGLVLLGLSGLFLAAAGPAEQSGALAAGTASVRVPAVAPPMALVWRGTFSGNAAFSAALVPGPDHEAEGPPSIAATEDGFAVLDALGAAVRFHDASGAEVRALSLTALGAEAAAAVDLALDDAGGVAVLIARGAGALALLDASGAVSARAELPLARSPATGLFYSGGALFAGYGDVRAWQPLRPLEPVRLGLPSAGGDCNGAILADGRAIVRCHGASFANGLREVAIEAGPLDAKVAAVEQVTADLSGGISAVLALRGGSAASAASTPGQLRRVAFRADPSGTVAWVDLGPDAPWFTHRAVAFTKDGQLLRLTGDASGPRVLRSAMRPVAGVTP